ncbi:CRISPR-associated endonuclease Cas1 [Gordonia sp. (in: high G+C Gram-positive bacteria)]|uniref:CRISPR-associated endonuclease Cas1 n=1 Tax=Gordonia sp. (in: high G+C Gram-positive bacteria) TaxID=84139 RepID=UPI003C713377
MSAIPISLVAHTVFCDRRTWLESVGERVDSAQIEAGFAAHSRVDSGVTDNSGSRSVEIAHEGLRLVGKCDVVREGPGAVTIVEYKATPVRRVPEVTAANVVQLCLQRMCLESAGTVVVGQQVYFTNHRRTVRVDLDEKDFADATEWVERTRGIIESVQAPPPLVDDPRCRFCSHVSVCLPDEHRASDLIKIRRIAVSDPAGDLLHLTTPGSRASIRSGKVVVHRSGEETFTVPIERVVGLVVHGNVDVSGALIREILWRGYGVVWCSGAGRVVGHARSARSPNGYPRLLQHARSFAGDLELARELIAAKIANQATQLRRGSRAEVGDQVRRIRQIGRAVGGASSITEIFGLEGEAASLYFELFRGLLSDSADPEIKKEWTGRQGRGATDPLNVALNYAYGLLVADCIRALHSCGLDPHAGFVHSSVRNKPALALDLMEQFRPVVADSAVLTAINNGQFTTADISKVAGSARLSATGRRALSAQYERRVAQEFTHPTFKYKVSWRRAIEVQARMILGVLDGSQSEYVGIRTR